MLWHVQIYAVYSTCNFANNHVMVTQFHMLSSLLEEYHTYRQQVTAQSVSIL